MTSEPGPSRPSSRPAARVTRPRLARALDLVERLGNRLPDPVVLFLVGLGATWCASKLLAGVSFSEIDPRTISLQNPAGSPIRIHDLLTGPAFAAFLAGMVKTYTDFHPLGVVLVAMFGVGVAEHAGFIKACLRALLQVTPRKLLTPMLILIGLLSHTAADAGYVLVIPMGGVLFHVAGRHPLAGIAAAFAGVSGGFNANPMVCALDPLLAGITQAAAGLLDTTYSVNPLCNYYFTASSSVIIVLVGWYLTDRVIEPRLRAVPIDEDSQGAPAFEPLSAAERRGLRGGLFVMVLFLLLLVAWAWQPDSALRSPAPDHSLIRSGPSGAPLMGAIVPLIMLLFLLPGIVHGYLAGTFKSHRDVIEGMSRAMGTMSYYLVLVFFSAIFIEAFNKSNLGALIALKGAAFLREMGAPAAITVVGVILVSAGIDLLVGSASAKWALLAPILVPMLMSVGISPELTQAAYRIGDSTTNIVTPMMPYFPLVVVFCQRYVKSTGIGTVVSLMLPYSVVFLVAWTGYLLAYQGLGLPLGLGVSYGYASP
ncbi:MAG TPA: AbgT family transporter [Polyangiaceae bacterium]